VRPATLGGAGRGGYRHRARLGQGKHRLPRVRNGDGRTDCRSRGRCARGHRSRVHDLADPGGDRYPLGQGGRSGEGNRRRRVGRSDHHRSLILCGHKSTAGKAGGRERRRSRCRHSRLRFNRRRHHGRRPGDTGGRHRRRRPSRPGVRARECRRDTPGVDITSLAISGAGNFRGTGTQYAGRPCRRSGGPASRAARSGRRLGPHRPGAGGGACRAHDHPHRCLGSVG
jgi:hypothetical protein